MPQYILGQQQLSIRSLSCGTCLRPPTPSGFSPGCLGGARLCESSTGLQFRPPGHFIVVRNSPPAAPQEMLHTIRHTAC